MRSPPGSFRPAIEHISYHTEEVRFLCFKVFLRAPWIFCGASDSTMSAAGSRPTSRSIWIWSSAPLQELGRQVHAAMTAAYPKEQLNLHVSRIYRDARRLHGRGPYKDHLWFTIRPEQEGWTHVPAFYFEIAPEYHSLGMGYYGAEPVTMAKFRSRIDRDPAPMEKLAAGSAGQHRFVLEGEMYKRPKGTRPPALSLVQPEKHRPDLGPQLRGLPVHPRAGWGGGGELPLPQALLRLLSLPPWRPSPGCLPLIPAAPGTAPGGRHPF